MKSYAALWNPPSEPAWYLDQHPTEFTCPGQSFQVKVVTHSRPQGFREELVTTVLLISGPAALPFMDL